MFPSRNRAQADAPQPRASGLDKPARQFSDEPDRISQTRISWKNFRAWFWPENFVSIPGGIGAMLILPAGGFQMLPQNAHPYPPRWLPAIVPETSATLGGSPLSVASSLPASC